MNSTKKSLFTSAVALFLCFAMLVGTTFAWFTDEVTSSGNIIQTGNLDANMYWSEELLPTDTDNPVADGWHNAAESKVFDYNNWEPGFSQFRYVLIENAGSLDFKWHLTIDADGKVTELAEVIEVYYITPGANGVSKADLNENNYVGTLDEVLARKDSNDGVLKSGERVLLAIAFHMQETAGNEYQNKALCEGGFSLNLIAAQASATGEYDSFDDLYDENAAAAIFPGFQGGSGNISLDVDENGYTTKESTADFGDVFFFIPIGVKLAEGYENVMAYGLPKDTSDSNVQLGDSEKMRPSDVHVDGVAEDNTKAILVTLRHYLTTGLNIGALKIFHVEDGATVAMTHNANPVNHNEFSYDPLTGDVTLALASFSEVAVVADTNNPWDGKTETAYTGSGTEADPYLIGSADQLAKFRTDVDNGNSFEGKFVKLANNIYLSNQLFDPIGWGYVNASHNRDVDGDGKRESGNVFMGTFDGNGKTIFDLHQSGWDLEVGDADYTYTNCGFGLFAAASNATFKDLTISGAYVRVECVEAGVLVGLSQNSCTYENINIYNAKIANYQRPAGGLIGEVSGEGTTTITNVTIGPDVVVGSLWGDFDAPCGGVIGARWDDVGANPQIKMKHVDVSCRLDVYNDVTSAYQWHAYRRAGMLIGNTDTPAANGKVAQIATADFLECIQVDGKDTVIVRLGSWANYTYCQFTNEENPGRNYPWVRVEAGENNSAYSNPRYGHPVDVNGNVVDGSGNHTKDDHKDGDIHNMTISFSQLYGGGQGVYGATDHPGVTMEGYRYSIIYINNDEVLSIQYVTEEMAKKTNPFIPNDSIAQSAAENWVKAQGYSSIVFDEWVTAGSKRAEIPATNTENVTVYPSFKTPYTARFVDLDGNVLDWCFFDNTTQSKSNITATEKNAKELLPPQDPSLVEFSNWEVHYYNAEGTVVTEAYDSNNFAKKHYETDVTIYPVYTYAGKLNLEPVDSDGDGKTNYYKVVATSALEETTIIPGEVLGIPVLVVEKLYKQEGNTDYSSDVVKVVIQEGVERLEHNAISHTAKLNEVELPNSLKYLGKNAFSRNYRDDKKPLYIKYNGTKAEWDALVAASHPYWTGGLTTDESGTIVECLDGIYTMTKESTFVSDSSLLDWMNSPAEWKWTPNS